MSHDVCILCNWLLFLFQMRGKKKGEKLLLKVKDSLPSLSLILFVPFLIWCQHLVSSDKYYQKSSTDWKYMYCHVPMKLFNLNKYKFSWIYFWGSNQPIMITIPLYYGSSSSLKTSLAVFSKRSKYNLLKKVSPLIVIWIIFIICTCSQFSAGTPSIFSELLVEAVTRAINPWQFCWNYFFHCKSPCNTRYYMLWKIYCYFIISN